MKILTNHIGYETRAPKTAFLQTREGESLPGGLEFILRSEETEAPVMRGSLGGAETVPGWKNRIFYRIDFSSLDAPGNYRIEIARGSSVVVSGIFAVGEGLLAESCLSDILFYFKSQRSSGIWDEADRKVPVFNSTKIVDAHGGWFDASGDYSKYLSHLSYANYLNPQQTPLVVWALLKLHGSLKENPRYGGTLLENRAREEALWGADFLVRMLDDQGFFYIGVFDKWSKDTDARVLCAFRGQDGILLEEYQAGWRQGGGMAVAALAAASRAGSRGDFEPRDYLAAAVKGWDHLEKAGPVYLDNRRENIIDITCALTAAVELYRASGEEKYLVRAYQRYEQLRDLYDADRGCFSTEPGGDRPFYHPSDAGLPLAALLEYRTVITDPVIKEEAEEFIRAAASREAALAALPGNPFGLARQWVKPVDGPAALGFFMPHKNESGYWWQGENARLGSLAYALGAARRLFPPGGETSSRLSAFALDQLHWILGRNPFDICMLQGRGRHNPRYEEHYPNAPGGICNGITAGFEDQDDLDFLPAALEGRGDHRWRWSEQWIPHAAWFLLALTTLSDHGRS